MKNNFYMAYAKCKKYPTKELVNILDDDFDYIYDYIMQKHYTSYYLNLLFEVIPLGMLKYRLREKLSLFGINK